RVRACLHGRDKTEVPGEYGEAEGRKPEGRNRGIRAEEGRFGETEGLTYTGDRGQADYLERCQPGHSHGDGHEGRSGSRFTGRRAQGKGAGSRGRKTVYRGRQGRYRGSSPPA